MKSIAEMTSNISSSNPKKSRLQANFGQWDTVFSRYFHELEYADTGRIIKGYSKGLNIKAPTDSYKELIDSMIRIVVKGKYLDKCKSITWYTNEIDKFEQRSIVTLYKEKYVLSAEYFDDKKIKEFLDKLYDLMLRGIEPEYLRPKFKPNGKVNVFAFDFVIKSMDKLHTYCAHLIASGEQRAVVEDYYRKYLDMHRDKMSK